MENKTYLNESFINGLVDQYIKTRDSNLKESILSSFDSYLCKYVEILCGRHPADINNVDTAKFVKMVSIDHGDCISSLNRGVARVRRIFSDYTKEDAKCEVVVFFLEALDRYIPMIATGKRKRPRISFTHYLQTRIRYSLATLIWKKQRDAMCWDDYAVYDDLIDAKQDSKCSLAAAIDIRWIDGVSVGDVFENLTKYERYLIWLKYESGMTYDEIGKIAGVHFKTIRRKIQDIKCKLLEFSQ